MIEYVVESRDNLELMMQSRLEMLRVVNKLPYDYEFSKELIDNSREYFNSVINKQQFWLLMRV